MRTLFTIIITSLLLCACAPAQAPAPQQPDDGRLAAVTDLYGREVELPETADAFTLLLRAVFLQEPESLSSSSMRYPTPTSVKI